MKRRFIWALNPAVTVALCGGLVLLVALAALACRRLASLADSAEGVAHTRLGTRSINDLVAVLGEEEASQRGFVLTGNAEFLVWHEAARQRFLEELGEVRELTRDDAVQQKNTARLEALFAERLGWAERIFKIYESQGPAAAARLAGAGRSEASLAEMHALVAAMLAHEGERLAGRAEHATAERLALYAIAVGGAASALVFAAALLLLNREVAQRLGVQARLGESDRLARTTVDALPAAVYLCDAEGHVTFFNEAAAALWGTRPELGKAKWCGSWKIYEPDGTPLPAEDCPMALALREGRPVLGREIVVERPDGGRRHVRPHPTPLRDSAGRLVGAVNLLEDITERRQADAALRESQGRLEAAQRQAQLGSWELDAGAPRGAWSREMFALFDCDPTIGPPTLEEFMAMVHPADRLVVEASCARALAGERCPDVEFRRHPARGLLRHFYATLEARTDRTGRVLGIAGTVQDITERKRTEAALVQEQTLMRTLLAHTPDRVYFKDRDSRILAASRSMAVRHGTTPESFRGRTDSDRFSEEHARQALEDEQRIVRTGEAMVDVEEKETWPDGSVSWASTTKLPLRDATGQIVGTFGISRDITARKESETRLREQAALLDLASDAIAVTDLDGRITFWNRSAERIYGWTAAEVLGRPIADGCTPAEMAKIEAARVAVMLDGAWRGELEFSDKHGAPLVLDSRITLVRDDAGQPKGRLHISTDITEKKQLAEQFLRAQRLESLGMLAAGIAHDLNNILAPILMGAPMLREHAADQGDLELLATLEKSAQRGAALVRQILGFCHGVGGGLQLMQPKHVLRDIAGFTSETFPKSLHFSENIPADLWPVKANPTQLHQVLLNLCVNARDAMPQGGTLRLQAKNRVLDELAAAAIPHARPGAFVVIEVADTGTGIAPEVLARIWEPFFTTKSADKGTGLGLATVRGIVAEHLGFVAVETAVGQGTTFRVFLPASADAFDGEAGRTASKTPRGDGELVLVADDEPSIRSTASAILTRHGYRVVTARDGLEAVETFGPRSEEIDLVMTDLDMPHLDGQSFLTVARRLNPTIKCLVATGSAEANRAGFAQPGMALLPKPFDAEQLLARVHALLHPAAA